MPEIDRLIVAHRWALDFFDDWPALRARSVPCPCGVDAEVWKRSDHHDRAGGCGGLEER